MVYTALTKGRKTMLPGQLSLFESTTPPSTSVVGLTVVLPRACRSCGETMTTIGSGKGPHHAALFCVSCGAHVGWMGRESFDFVTTVIDNFGRPEAAIVVRSNVEKGN
jgi:hypothetical protein